MKVWTVSAVSLGLAASVASAEIVQFNEKMLALSGHPVRKRGTAIRFNTFQSEPLPPTLQTREGHYGGSERIECSISEGYKNSGTATVVLAISKCLPQSEIDVVEAWISKVKAENHLYEDNGELKEISFSTTFVPGECQELTESEKAGRMRSEDKPSEPSELSEPILLSEGASYRSFKDVQPGESARLQAFAQYGRVLEGPDDLEDDGPPVAMMSFVNNEHSYDYVMGLEATYKISNTFNFEICREGVSCNGHFENCIALHEMVDVFVYNPFQITRSFQCSRLDGGIPVTYADEHGERQCFCTCPAGSEMKEDETKQGSYKCVTTDPDVCPCTWSTHPFGFKYENTEKLTQCSFTNIATQWGVPVPFPLDNYVADLRTNNKDAFPDELPFGPRIDVSVTPMFSDEFDHEKLVGLHDHVMAGQPMPDLPPDLEEMFNVFGQGEIPPVYEPPTPYGEKKSAHYTWKDYQVNSLDKIDDIKLTAYGKYELSVNAFDYTATSAQCIGCVAVVDKFRPKATTACPVSFCDDTTSLCATGETAVAELTADNVKKADGLVDDFYQFKQKAVNDACGDNRCDDDAFSYRDFFESASSSHNKPFASGRTCFTTLEDDFMTSAVATTNPLKLENGKSCQSPNPVDSTQCMRCCEYSTALREIWTDYSCGYDYDERYCDGDADQKCSFKQCLVLKGDMLVQASASIKKDVCDHSKEVLKGLSDQGFQTYTQIHRALPCSDFGEAGSTCSYTTSISQLLDIDTTNKFGGDTNTYAFWRYKIDGDKEGWRLWEDQTPFEFLHTQTKITLEAWTACGRARKFYFYVHLHPHSDIKVCEVFKQMWYQTSKSRVEVPTELCAYPGSDFAELTFDYQANIGLKHSRNNLHLSIADVTCSLAFHDRTPIEILHVNSGSFEILQRYAIELQNQATTTEDTQFTVTCKFTYAGPGDVLPVEKTCPLELTITDCNGPTIDIPQGDCTWDDCAGQAAPGPYEACGGHVVHATATATYMDTEDTECCKACQPLVCTPVLNLPDAAQDIKRCVPKDLDDEYEKAMYSNFQFDGGYYDRAAVFMATAVVQHPMAVVATAFMGVSALVAVVALVVVRRRRADAAVVVEDAYYPLLH